MSEFNEKRNDIKKELKETKENMKMSWNFIKKSKKSLVFMILLSILLSIISVIIPTLSAQLLIKLSNGLLMELFKVAVFIFIIEVSRNIISAIFRKVTDNYMINTIIDVQMEMFKEILKIEVSEIDKNTSGAFIDRINNDTNEIINIFSDLTSVMIDLISNVGILLAVFFISKAFFVYFLVTSLIINYVNKQRRKIYFKLSKRYMITREKRTGLTSEIIRGIRDVKLLNASNGILKKTERQLHEIGKERKQMTNINQKYTFISGTIRDLFDVLFIALGIILVSKNNLSVSNFVILYMYRGRIESLLTFYDKIAETIKHYNLSATRVFEVLGNKFAKEENNTDDIVNLDGNIEFRNVSFSYGEGDVLNDISFKINSGERIGFVGVSGSGKTTIFNLITKLYKIKEGKILIDNFDIKYISPYSLRKNISLISQNPYIFNFSIEENLKIGNYNATESEMIDACKKAKIYDYIMSLEDKFKTVVGEGGMTLSGGEKQRLAIARCLLKNSKIILFDEATSALDNITQDMVQKAIYGLDRDKTILIIAHRLSTIINCDRIIVIDDGKIVDIGVHEELLKRCKRYKDLYKFEKRNNY